MVWEEEARRLKAVVSDLRDPVGPARDHGGEETESRGAVVNRMG